MEIFWTLKKLLRLGVGIRYSNLLGILTPVQCLFCMEVKQSAVFVCFCCRVDEKRCFVIVMFCFGVRVVSVVEDRAN